MGAEDLLYLGLQGPLVGLWLRWLGIVYTPTPYLGQYSVPNKTNFQTQFLPLLPFFFRVPFLLVLNDRAQMACTFFSSNLRTR